MASKRRPRSRPRAREGIARSAGFTSDGRVGLVVFSVIPSDLSDLHG